MTDDGGDEVEAEEAEEEVVERLPRWLAPVAVLAVVVPVLAIGGWSTLWRPDAGAWGQVKCRVEADRAWPTDDLQHDVVYERCLEQLP